MPYGAAGTYPLTEVQRDRFAYNVRVSHAPPEEEMEILARIDEIESGVVKQVADIGEVLEAIEAARSIYVSDAVRRYIVDLVAGLRANEALVEGPSARASIWLMKASKAYALIHGRGYVIPDDVKAVAPHVLRHRIVLRREVIEEVDEESVIMEALEATPVPKR
jgi:MoxR-like ATPase